jgi:hypothetical protein
MGLFEQEVLFTSEECESIIKRYSSLEPDDSIKNSTSSYEWKNLHKVEDGWILDRFINWASNKIGCEIQWDNNRNTDEFYFQTYKKGDKFGKHTDNGYDRAYTIGLLLNNKFEGGNFLVDVTPDNSVSFKNVIGNCYIIESMLKHELKEITEGERHIVLVFIKNSQIKFADKFDMLHKII